MILGCSVIILGKNFTTPVSSALTETPGYAKRAAVLYPDELQNNRTWEVLVCHFSCWEDEMSELLCRETKNTG